MDSRDSAANLVGTLLDAARAGRTGVLRFERGKAKKQLVLRSGFVVFAGSNLPEEHLARILVALKLLKRPQLKDIAALMKSGMNADEAVLQTGLLDGEAVSRGAREQAEFILASVFGWTEYETRFYAGEALIRRRIDLRLPVPELLVSAARRAVADHMVASLAGPLVGTIAAANRRPDLMNLPLNSAEAYAFSRLQSATTADNLLSLIPTTGARPEELVKRLILLGLAVCCESVPAESPAAESGSDSLSHLEDLLQKFEVANLYEILSVAPTATEAEIKLAYHELAKRYHPDHFQSSEHGPEIRSLAEKLFTFITGAYTTLGNPAGRSAYDKVRLQRESRGKAAVDARAAVDDEKDKIAETLFRAGRQALAAREFEKAAEKLKECAWLRPDSARYQHFLGVAQSEIPRLRKEAEQHLLKACELDRTGIGSRLALGKLYVKAGLLRRAESCLKEVLAWDPTHAEASRLLDEIARTPAGARPAQGARRFF